MFTQYAAGVQFLHDLALRFSLFDEQIIDSSNCVDFQLRPRNQNDAVRLQALSFALPKRPFEL